MSNKAYYHDDDTKETLRISQTPDLEEEGWLTEVKILLHIVKITMFICGVMDKIVHIVTKLRKFINKKNSCCPITSVLPR
jgi:hypothetical protein